MTRRSNLTPQRAKDTVNDLSAVSVVPKSLDIKQVGFTISSLFFPKTSKLQSAAYSEWNFTAAEYTEEENYLIK